MEVEQAVSRPLSDQVSLDISYKSPIKSTYVLEIQPKGQV